MEPLAVFPSPAPPELAQVLDLSGWAWKSVANESELTEHEPEMGWGGAIVVADDDPTGAFAVCRALRKVEIPLEPLLLLILYNKRPASR